jgi:hypothetical protein
VDPAALPEASICSEIEIGTLPWVFESNNQRMFGIGGNGEGAAEHFF